MLREKAIRLYQFKYQVQSIKMLEIFLIPDCRQTGLILIS
jgi:hypothetical protein